MSESKSKGKSRTSSNDGYEKLLNPVPLRLDEDTDIMITALAQKRKETKQDVMRRILKEGAQAEFLEKFAADELLSLIRKAMLETSKPTEERIVKLLAKAGIAASTSLYLNLEALGTIGKMTVTETTALHQRARQKGMAFVKTPNPVDNVHNEDN
ncbi:hypothetical protein [Paenibacillus agilis]|uniref:Uncharacterized protein n=1 Tax=Paenibacillus agilis TaxID=3020863 RepID=A0A559IDV1_9BACL|nr:hypothetical protein [Paenibacillus agilis]TVX85633.1 hypothetical protein FPZ44_25105 [Paenibacillus agilis]